MSLAGQRIWVAGHRGMVGSALMRRLSREPGVTLISAPREKLDLLDAVAVRRFIERERPDHVVLAAAKVGGIGANEAYPADFIAQNLAIQNHVILAAHEAGVPRLLFLGSSCIYPRDAPQPLREEALLTGPLEPTNEPYALAKIAGIGLCEALGRQHGRDYRAVMPTNLYGPGDNFHPTNSHVLPALMRRFDEAVRAGTHEVLLWGAGTARREFLHVDDMADACVHVMSLPIDRWLALVPHRRPYINVGTGEDLSIRDLANRLAFLTGFTGTLRWDRTRPEGALRKQLDVSRLTSSGWRARIPLDEGLAATLSWYRAERHRALTPDVRSIDYK